MFPNFLLKLLTKIGENIKLKVKIIFKMTEKDEFIKFCQRRRLRTTSQRIKILSIFLSTEGHPSALQLYHLMRRKGIEVGYSTVYRTLEILVDSGIARKIELGDREAHFEHKLRHAHHDHLVCVKCGKSIEFLSPTIEKLQKKIAKEKNFFPQRHSLVIYGLCEGCR